MIESPIERRQLGTSGIHVTPVGMGCWPITGMTSLDVNETDSMQTLRAAIDCGINFFDTAYGYGTKGESEGFVSRAIAGKRDDVVLATKCGLGWDENVERVIDGRPRTLRRHVDESLSRLGRDHVDLLYLHAPDPRTPLAESAGALREIRDAGKTRLVGVSNFSVDQLQAFHAVCPITVVQPPYNMLQRQIECDIVPWCRSNRISLAIYWPLLKGLLAGKLSRDYVFQPGDGRAKYPMFRGQEWEKNQDFVEDLRVIATECNRSVAQIAVRWTLQQPGITAALCGAKRAYQIQETAAAMRFSLDPKQLNQIDAAMKRRGVSQAHGAV